MFLDLKLGHLASGPGKTEPRGKAPCWGSAGWAAYIGFSEGLGKMVGLMHIQS